MDKRKPKYLFFELRTSEILQIMEDLRFPITEADINKPNAAQVQRLYEFFLESMMEVPKTVYSQPRADILDMCEHPAIHVDNLILLQTFRYVKKFMDIVGMHDFCLQDMTAPEPFRMRLIYSAVINFAKFREEQLELFEECNHKSDQSINERNELSSKVQVLKENIKSLKLQRSQELPQMNAIKAKLADIATELKEYKRETTSLTTEFEQLKSERSELSDKIAADQFHLMNIKKECQTLKSRIVQSPEILIQTISELKNSISHEKSSQAMMESRLRDLQLSRELATPVVMDLKKSVELLEQTSIFYRKWDQAKTLVSNENDRIEGLQANIRNMKKEIEQLVRQISAVDEKIVRLRQQFPTKMESLEQQLAELDLDSNDEIKLAIDKTEKLCKEMEQKITDLNNKHKSDLQCVQNEFLQLKNQVRTYIKEVSQEFY